LCEPDVLYVSLLMPSLAVGTVGGGTSLAKQREALTMLGCAGSGGKTRLAQIIAGFCLALELSTFSASVEGTFADAHKRLGRHSGTVSS
jgi:hydroxymethylglutaryl-CoA reductase (NADPH)